MLCMSLIIARPVFGRVGHSDLGHAGRAGLEPFATVRRVAGHSKSRPSRIIDPLHGIFYNAIANNTASEGFRDLWDIVEDGLL